MTVEDVVMEVSWMRLVPVLVGLALACTVGCSAAASDDSPPAGKADSLSLVVIGDSIPYNSSNDCPGCTGFVDQYATYLEKATGKRVRTTNRSEHTGLTLPDLMAELPELEKDLRGADVVIVGVAHNSIPLNADLPCGSAFDEATSTLADWSKVDASCAETGTRTYRPMYDELYSTIAGWRKGKPTRLLTIDKYSDWLGWPEAHLTPDQGRRTVLVHDAWNQMLCASAQQNGFTCADVYHAFNGPRGTKPSGDLLGADYTHPSQKGNDLIAKTLIDQGLGPLER